MIKRVLKTYEPTPLTQSNARPTGDQEVAGSIPAGSAIFFHGD